MPTCCQHRARVRRRRPHTLSIARMLIISNVNVVYSLATDRKRLPLGLEFVCEDASRFDISIMLEELENLRDVSIGRGRRHSSNSNTYQGLNEVFLAHLGNKL
jgi:hypothetical protein